MSTDRPKAIARSAIAHFMTLKPHCIGRDQTLAAAHARMRDFRVRHLPVLDAGKLVGILSQPDLFFVETLRDVDPEKVRVEDAMSHDVYVVPPERPIGEVAAKMLQRKHGCAVVAHGAHLEGIFTRSDALRVLVNIVEAWL